MKHIILPLLIFFGLSATLVHAATFDVVNLCSYTVWAGAAPGGCQRLDQGQTWTFDLGSVTDRARIWGVTICNDINGSGIGQFETVDCNSLLVCQSGDSLPITLAEFTLNQPNNLDHFDISLVYGFSIPIGISPTNGACRGIQCNADINGQCPSELKAPGGCNNPCTVFQTNEYCCTNGPGSCGPTNFSKFFKDRCPDAYSYPQDNKTSVVTCPGGTNYRVTFCPHSLNF